jgi:hypothetical protein
MSLGSSTEQLDCPCVFVVYPFPHPSMTAPPSRAPHENPRGQVTQGIFFYPTTSENLVHICPILYTSSSHVTLHHFSLQLLLMMQATLEGSVTVPNDFRCLDGPISNQGHASPYLQTDNYNLCTPCTPRTRTLLHPNTSLLNTNMD